MIRNDIDQYFSHYQKPRWPPYCSEYVKRSLEKTRKYEVTVLLLKLKCKPIESITYLDHQYFIILNLST